MDTTCVALIFVPLAVNVFFTVLSIWRIRVYQHKLDDLDAAEHRAIASAREYLAALRDLRTRGS